jgi:hypothetical protein
LPDNKDDADADAAILIAGHVLWNTYFEADTNKRNSDIDVAYTIVSLNQGNLILKEN